MLSEFRVQMLPKRRRVQAESPHRAVTSSAPPPARFPGVAIYLAEPRMGRSRRAFLTRLARSKGFRILDAYRCAAPARARCWWDASLAGAGIYAGHPSVWTHRGSGREMIHLRLWVLSQPWHFAVAVPSSNSGVPQFERVPSHARGFLSHTKKSS